MPKDILETVDDINIHVRLGEFIDRHQWFFVQFESTSKKLRWEVSHNFNRFRQLSNIIKATSAEKILSIDFPEHHHTGATSRVRWLGSMFIDKEKTQDERRKYLELWLAEIVQHANLFSPAVRGDLSDFMNPNQQKNETATSSSMSKNSDSSRVSETISENRFTPRKERRTIIPQAEVEIPLKNEIFTNFIVACLSAFNEKVMPDSARVATAVTCISRSGNVTTYGTITSIIGDFCISFYQQAKEVNPFAFLIFMVTVNLGSFCTWLGFQLQFPWALQLLFASSALYFTMRWRENLFKVIDANVCNKSSAQEHLQAFCQDRNVLFSLEPSQSRPRFSSAGGSDMDSLSPISRKRGKSRSASVFATRDLSSQSFDRFEFSDVLPEAKKHYWDAGSSHHFELRGATYLEDKTKSHPGPAMLKLMLMELYEVDASEPGDRHDHICSKGLAKKRIEAISSLPGKPFIFVINFQIPGDPPISMVAYFALPPNILEMRPGIETERFIKTLKKFADVGTEEERLASWSSTDGGDVGGCTNTTSSSWLKVPSDIQWPIPQEHGAYPQSDYRNKRFKLIANITDGPWVVKATVPAKPALLGKKVVCRYFGGDNYVEADLHVGSSIIACQVTSLCRGYVRQFGADLAIIIQGDDETELPERILGCLHIHKIDLDLRRSLYEDDLE